MNPVCYGLRTLDTASPNDIFVDAESILTEFSLSFPVLCAQARSRQCLADGCGKRPVFNYPGEKLPVYCQAHKLDAMVDVLNRLCTSPGMDHC